MKINKGATSLFPGAFCDLYGKTAKNRVLEYALENQDIDYAVGDLARETGISRPKAYQVVEDLLSIGILKESRVVGRTQLIRLNPDNPKVRLLRNSFSECLRIVAEEHQGREIQGMVKTPARKAKVS